MGSALLGEQVGGAMMKAFHANAGEDLRDYFSLRPGRPDIGTEQEWLARADDRPGGGG